MITVNALSKSFQTRHERVDILKNITLTIPDKSFVLLLGESGSGKSTLCNILGLLDNPTSGEYYLDKIAVHTLSSSGQAHLRRNKIGFIFQNYNLIQTMTAYENIELPLGYRGIPKEARHKTVEKALTSVGLSYRATHFPTELSGGEQQRIAIARALATEPSYLFADEPTGNLDEKTTREIMALLKQTCQEKTVFMVTHDRNLIPYGDIVLEASRGEVRFL